MSGELYARDAITGEPISGVRIAVFDPMMEDWIRLGETNSDGCLLYSERGHRGSYLCRARKPSGYKPYEDTVKFNSPTIIFLDKDIYKG